MAMKRSDMASAIQYNLGNVTGLTARILDWMNWAQEDIVSVFNWRDLFVRDKTTLATQPDTLEYALPENCKDIKDVKLKDGASSRSLVAQHPDLFRKQHPSPEDDGAGSPKEYTWEGPILKLWPIPSEANPIWLFYVRWPGDFDTNADNTCIIKRVDKAIVAQATAYGYAARRELDKNVWWHRHAWTLLRRSARAERNRDWTPQWATQRTVEIRRYEQGLWTPPTPAGDEITQLSYS